MFLIKRAHLFFLFPFFKRKFHFNIGLRLGDMEEKGGEAIININAAECLSIPIKCAVVMKIPFYHDKE